MGVRSFRTRVRMIQLLILLSGVILSIQADPAELPEDVTHPPPPVQLQTEPRSHKDEVLDVDEDLDGRSAYINNQFVPSEPAEVMEDEQSAPLFEMLQKQMEQVLASSAPNDPVYEQREKLERRDQQAPHQPPYFSEGAVSADLQDDYEEEEDQTDQGYSVDSEKPDAVGSPEEEEAGYQAPLLIIPNSTTRKPYRRRSTTTTSQPRTTKSRTPLYSRTTAKPFNQTITTDASPPYSSTTSRPKIGSSNNSKANPYPVNNLPSNPQVYQHKRRIVFKTISTGSQFINSPIGDLMIKFSIGFAKPTTSGGAVSSSSSLSSSNEALRALSRNLIRNLDMQKLTRANKVKKD